VDRGSWLSSKPNFKVTARYDQTRGVDPFAFYNDLMFSAPWNSPSPFYPQGSELKISFFPEGLCEGENGEKVERPFGRVKFLSIYPRIHAPTLFLRQHQVELSLDIVFK